jgi:hypothetical protein
MPCEMRSLNIPQMCVLSSPDVSAGTVACVLTHQLLSRRVLFLTDNELTSLDGVTLPASLK